MARHLAACTAQSTDWLAAIQNQENGGWGEYKGAPTNSLNTAEAVLALVASGNYHAGDQSLQRAVEYLKSRQLGEHNSVKPEDHGAWGRGISEADKVIFTPDTIHTSFALLALNTAGIGPSDTPVTAGVQWLLKSQNQNGGWGYTYKRDSRLFPACLALKALLRIHHAGHAGLKAPIEKGLAHVHTTYKNADGSFGGQPGLVVAHTLHVIDTFKIAREYGFGLDPKNLEYAVVWIGQHEGGVTQWANETIVIGEDDANHWNYTFTYVTPALYLSAFGTNLAPKDPIAKEALQVIHDNIDPHNKGFAAKRAVSWATAKCILGLTAVNTVYENFPERRMRSYSLEGRHLTFLLMLLLIALTGILSLTDNLGTREVAFLSLILFAALLVHGYISEKTFLDIVLAKWRLKKKVTKG